MSEDLWFRILCGVSVGLVLGSFVTMLSYRLPRGISIVMPRSHCPACKTQLGARDLVPVFSWLFSGGKCRHCGRRISARYPLIELVVAAGATVSFVAFGFCWMLLFALFMTVAAASAVTIMIERRKA